MLSNVVCPIALWLLLTFAGIPTSNPMLIPHFHPSCPQLESCRWLLLSRREITDFVAGEWLQVVRVSGLVAVRCAAGDVGEENGDVFYMRRCVELARKAVGCTSPNPMVGCVIVKDGKVVGEWFHPKARQPHAEVFALRDAGDLAENATAYVSLEPCNHYRRTPPCTEALIKAKVKKVIMGMVNPNPKVDSKGVDRLRAAGIEVTVGIDEELCKKLNEPFIRCMLTRKPFISLRYSISEETTKMAFRQKI